MQDGVIWNLEALPSIPLIQTRLSEVFPEGVDERSNLTGERTAKVVFVFLYI